MTDLKSPEEFQGKTPDLQGKGALGWYKPPTDQTRKLHEGDDLTQQSKPSTTEPDSFTKDQTENEEGIKPEEVELNQEFLLFDPKRTKKRMSALRAGDEVHSVPTYSSGIALKISGETLSFNIFTVLSKTRKESTLTPFHTNPNLGYEITNEDFNSTTRTQKLELDKSLYDYIPFEKAPLWLRIETGTDLSKKGFTIREPVKANLHQLTEKGEESLDQLKLILTFPEGTFISAWDRTGLKISGDIDFNKFYPAEIGGPLPLVHHNSYSGTFGLFLPSNSTELEKITGMFVNPTKESEKD